MKLNVNFSEVPDSSPPIDVGEYYGDITKIDLLPPSGKQGERYEFTYKITSDGPNKDRLISDNFQLNFLSDPRHFVTIRLGNLVQSAGYKKEALKEGLELDELIGKSIRFTTKQSNVMKDGVTRTYTNVDKYIFSA